ncbi:hypothetical protein L917_00019 [Phytophthora nicotianae]|uniref:Uncharacterized protein n=1 Tax=Phytophthora nicotianae TaxID=4792 RepID=W2M4M6_PHYNI|nr:hypothetical protein L917_00019 [Phytophthora nicotianae]
MNETKEKVERGDAKVLLVFAGLLREKKYSKAKQ